MGAGGDSDGLGEWGESGIGLGCEEGEEFIVSCNDAIDEGGGPIEEALSGVRVQWGIVVDISIEQMNQAGLGAAAEKEGLGVAILEAFPEFLQVGGVAREGSGEELVGKLFGS